ncbi:hypothetical protein PanWU01x14_055610 [Parasponia andersonii]|uniref:Uncharacterized protein n=1 Tax=Parasponia andersonii TaxID=3476 RepID=A0A2P5DK74_PARAD|nr:hypothetical protein PanWU01x14_055610 [Parasponia andersonii]
MAIVNVTGDIFEARVFILYPKNLYITLKSALMQGGELGEKLTVAGEDLIVELGLEEAHVVVVFVMDPMVLVAVEEEDLKVERHWRGEDEEEVGDHCSGTTNDAIGEIP